MQNDKVGRGQYFFTVKLYMNKLKLLLKNREMIEEVWYQERITYLHVGVNRKEEEIEREGEREKEIKHR